MKKLRYYLAIIALAATLSGFSSQVMGLGTMANAASRWYVSSPFAVGQSPNSVAANRYPACPFPGANDC
jgi:hypothetical protein